MEMVTISSGKLRAIGYDRQKCVLQVELNDGSTLLYSGTQRVGILPTVPIDLAPEFPLLTKLVTPKQL